MKLSKIYSIYKHKKKLNDNKKRKIIDLIKEENYDSIIASASFKVISEYLDIAVKSQKLYLFTLENKKELIGYALLAKKPKYLFSEFSSLRIKLFLNLIFKIKLLSIMNLVISFTDIDKIFLNKRNIFIIQNNLNLNLLAIKKKYQSKGIGYFFMKKIIYKEKKNKNNSYITCETFSSDAVRFYTKKLKFKVLGKKIRFFKKMLVLSLKIK